MRYCRFETPVGPQYGRVVQEAGVDCIVSALELPESPATLSTGFTRLRLDEVKLLAPAEPSKVICVGRNYREHANELGNEVPAEPLIFLKPPSSIIGPGDAIKLPPASITQRVDYEAELGFVIGKQCRNLRNDEEVRPYIRGYTCVNDVTARDLQKKDGQWTRAKGFDTFCALGPVVTDEMELAKGVDVEAYLNGERKQHGNTREFIFSVEQVLRYISQVMTLMPGDLISTGTPAGVGPMKSGDTIEVRIAGVGSLVNRVE